MRRWRWRWSVCTVGLPNINVPPHGLQSAGGMAHRSCTPMDTPHRNGRRPLSRAPYRHFPVRRGVA